MSIKSDRWIRRMAVSMGMIEPFSPDQVRLANGHKIVSYGTSSYGYDVRCAEEFKIFTNINSTIVDPKAFDEKSFVDFNGPVCIIPPNSFALARTVEFFRIPRSVLTICLGKCVTGDTRLVDAATGAYVPITEMRWGNSTLAWDGSRLKPSKVSAFIPQGVREVFELRTRAGLRIRATANHPFLMRDRWIPLEELTIGDRIAVAREIPVFGTTAIPDWEATLLGLVVSDGQCETPSRNPTYVTADPAMMVLLELSMARSGLGEVTDNGRYGYPDWLRKLELDVETARKFVPQSIFMAPESSVRLFLQALLSGDGSVCHSDADVFLEYNSCSRRLIEDVQHLLLRFGIVSLLRETTAAIGASAYQIQITDKNLIRRFAERIGFSPGSLQQQRLVERIVPMIAVRASRAATSARGGRSVSALSVHSVNGPGWDEVESIESAGSEAVFDITVPMLHNFVANNFIVHNSTYARCGIICNVTPLEPEWEGHVTLEFSNTTPLPAKIYANEGVAQMLFFESDEVCETSYRDRGGKYQGQLGVTLPKA